MKSGQNKYMVPALERGMKIIELLADHPAGMTMSEMHSLGLPAASLYRMLVTLAELEYVVREAEDRYRLTRKLLSVGYRSVDESSIIEKAVGPMRELRNACCETVLLGLLYGNEGVVIEQAVSNQAVKVSVQIGHHFPLHTAAPAKAILAHLPDDEMRSLTDSIKYTVFTEKTIKNRHAYEAELETVRKQGIAFDRGEELEEIRCAAAPVMDPKGYPIASIWISGPVSRLTEKKLKEYSVLVKQTAKQISLKFA